MKKIASLIILTAVLITTLCSCANKLSVSENDQMVLAYEYNGASILSNISGTSATVVKAALDGLEISHEAPKDAKYVDGVYLMVGKTFFHLDLNGSNVVMIGDKEGYVEVEQFRYDAIIALYDQFGTNIEFGK